MQYEGDGPSPCIKTYRNGPYSSSIASSTSSSSASLWSDASSQSSDDSSIAGLDSDALEAYSCRRRTAPACATSNDISSVPGLWGPQGINEVPSELRQNPRRTSIGASSRTCPPALVRQSDRKVNFVENLVDNSALIVEAIWPLASVAPRSEVGGKGVLPLRTFIQETLRRSRTSYSTLQVALYYLILIRPHVPKLDFTMEQPNDIHSLRALQCGRRMFLSALILASKYLQDRNYSARAWSKISGLNALEINQNEMAFLLAVNWRLHITDLTFQRWTDIVLKYTPQRPQSSGTACQRLVKQTAEWKSIVLRLNPEMDNIEGVAPAISAKVTINSLSATPPRYIPLTADRYGDGSAESTPTPIQYTPALMEPSPTTSYPTTKPAPALGLLPTPRLTPQSSGFSTPAVSATSCLLKPSMGYAMTQANVQMTERWQPHQLTSSPTPYTCRRSSLANSVSLVSSPESMVSDTSSQSSRSASISSASSLMSAHMSSKLDVQARCRYAKQCSEKYRLMIATQPESSYYNNTTTSPESYTGPIGKEFVGLSLNTPLARQAYPSLQPKDEEAARALQELHSQSRSSVSSPSRAGNKRSRTESVDGSLQENVRGLLLDRYSSTVPLPPTTMNSSPISTRSTPYSSTSASSVSPGLQFALPSAAASTGRKRICRATEEGVGLGLRVHGAIHPAFGGKGGVGMWSGILN